MPELLGREIAQDMDAELARRVEHYREEVGLSPMLAILTDNIAHKPTETYVNLKAAKAHQLGIGVHQERRPGQASSAMAERVAYLGEVSGAHGIIVQLPLSQPEYTDLVTASIPSAKDVDGLGGESPFDPATPSAILRLLEGNGVDYVGERVTLLGRGRLVGLPLHDMLERAGAEVYAFDEGSTQDEIRQGIRESSLVVSAMGRPGLVTPEWFEHVGSRVLTVVDAGTAEQDGEVRGDVSDVARDWMLERDWNITAKKGGVGPLTIRTLLENTLDAAYAQQEPASPPLPFANTSA